MKWDYQTIVFDNSTWLGPAKLDGDDLNTRLCDQGAAGWELVNVFTVHGGNNMQIVAVMKRPLQMSGT